MSDSYRVPKRPVSVQLRTARYGEESGTIFLCDRAESHSGPESPLDLLNGSSTFLPVVLASQAVRIVSRDHIVSVMLPPCVEDPAEPYTGTVVKVCVALADGSQLEGGFAYDLPDAHSRIQDFLNDAGTFIELYTAEGLTLVNKLQIAHVSVV